MPSAIVTDLLVHGNDLIASTQGRAIWILDDVSPLRGMPTMPAGDTAHLFAPATAVRLRRNQSKDTPLPPEEPAGKNPPTGAVLDYWLAADATTPVRLTVRDAQGTVVKTFDSSAPAEGFPADRYFTERWIGIAPVPSAKAGAHRFVWDLRGRRPRVGEYEFSIGAVDGDETSRLPEGMLVPPGDYQVALTAGEHEYVRTLHVVADPRVPLDLAALSDAASFSHELVTTIERQSAAAAQVAEVKKQLDAARAKVDPAAVAAFNAKLATIAAKENDETPNLDSAGGALRELEIDLEGSDLAPTAQQREAASAHTARLNRALALWEGVKQKDLPALNAALRKAGLKEIVLP
jgi:hypothetical protein